MEAELVQALAQHRCIGGECSLTESGLSNLAAAHNSQYGQTIFLQRLG
jgi:hypothetical protein